MKSTPSKDRQASPIQIPTSNIKSSILKSISKDLKTSNNNDDRVYKGDVFIYKPSFPGMEYHASPQQTLNLSVFLSPQ